MFELLRKFVTGAYEKDGLSAAACVAVGGVSGEVIGTPLGAIAGMATGRAASTLLSAALGFVPVLGPALATIALAGTAPATVVAGYEGMRFGTDAGCVLGGTLGFTRDLRDRKQPICDGNRAKAFDLNAGSIHPR